MICVNAGNKSHLSRDVQFHQLIGTILRILFTTSGTRSMNKHERGEPPVIDINETLLGTDCYGNGQGLPQVHSGHAGA